MKGNRPRGQEHLQRRMLLGTQGRWRCPVRLIGWRSVRPRPFHAWVQLISGRIIGHNRGQTPVLSTMIFITHQIPRGLAVDEVFSFGNEQQARKMEVVEEKR